MASMWIAEYGKAKGTGADMRSALDAMWKHSEEIHTAEDEIRLWKENAKVAIYREGEPKDTPISTTVYTPFHVTFS